MQLPVEISYRGVEKTDDIDDLIAPRPPGSTASAIISAGATSQSKNRITRSNPATPFASEWM